MNNKEIKEKLIEELFKRNIYTRKVNEIQYLTRCPFCGDSRTNKRVGHMYLRINVNDNYPIVYNCFKCPAHGVLKSNDLDMFEIDDNNMKNGLDQINKSSSKFDTKGLMNESTEIYFDYKLPDTYDSNKIKYIEDRLGVHFTNEQLQDLKVITSFKHFLLLNNIKTVTCKPYIAHMIENDYIGFLSNKNSHILFRDTTGKNNYRWIKYPITKESINNKLFYSITTDIDLLSRDEITINLSEGVMDCVSVAHNLNNINKNTLNIAVCGKTYSTMLDYLIGMGFIGDNITINIYSDKDYNKDTGKQVYDTTIDFYKKSLEKYTYVFKEINVFYNLKSKDCGVKKEEIALKKYRV